MIIRVRLSQMSSKVAESLAAHVVSEPEDLRERGLIELVKNGVAFGRETWRPTLQM